MKGQYMRFVYRIVWAIVTGHCIYKGGYALCMVFHVRWIFSPWVSESHPSRLRRRWDSETSGEKCISHGKPYKMHFLSYVTLQGTLVMLNTLHKVKDHHSHARWIYLTTVLYIGESQKYVRQKIPHISWLSLDIHWLTRYLTTTWRMN